MSCERVDVNFKFIENKKEKKDSYPKKEEKEDNKEWPLLFAAIEKENNEIVKLLLSNKKIDINAVFDVLNQFFRIY